MVLYHHKKPRNTVFTCLYEEINAYILRMRVYNQHYPPTHQGHFNDKDKHMISWKSQVITFIAKAWSKLHYFCSLHQNSALLLPSVLNFILLKQPGRFLTVQDFKTRINPRRFFTKKHSSWLYTKILWYIILIHNNWLIDLISNGAKNSSILVSIDSLVLGKYWVPNKITCHWIFNGMLAKQQQKLCSNNSYWIWILGQGVSTATKQSFHHSSAITWEQCGIQV